MAMLATLEGDAAGISLNDLFDVNDFLGVKMFGPEDWNRIKKCVCIITSKAANNPILFYIDSLKDDFPNYQASKEAVALLGFNDVEGRRVFGSIPWERLKVKIDNELLGSWNPIKKVKKAASAVVDTASNVGSKVVTGAKAVINAPEQVLDYVTTETPLAMLPTSMLYQAADNYIMDPIRGVIKDTTQKVIDAGVYATDKVINETPLQYVPALRVVGEGAKALEAVGIATPGTAGIYESAEQKEVRENAEYELQRRAAEAAAKAASKASALRSTGVDAANKKKALTEQLNTVEAQRAETQKNLDIMESRVTSRYAPIVIGGIIGLLALSILKGKKGAN